MNIAIIGAGPAGLAAAWELSKRGENITLYETDKSETGGLAGAVPVNDTYIDRFYHHIFTSDTDVLDLISEMGLSKDMLWVEPKNGIFLNGTLYPFTSPMDLITLPEVSLIGRFRMGLAVLMAKNVKDYRSMEGVNARDWLIQKTGKDAYEKIWRNLLYSKFDKDADSVSGVWIWNKFKLRGSTRQNISKEMLGYLSGSFFRLYEILANRLKDAGAKIVYEPVTRINGDGGKVVVESARGATVYDKALFTAAPALLCGLCDFPAEYKTKAVYTKYKSNICMTIITKQQVSDYYWITVAQRGAPFVLFIEHTNLIKDADYKDKHIIYLSRYVDETDPFFQASDDEIKGVFFEYLGMLFPGFRREAVMDSYINRAVYAQPVVGLNYSKHILPFETPVKRLYLASMAQIYPEDRGQNYAVNMGRKIAKIMSEEKL
ncbi:MAG: NAD(P)/FAD-dependent oxidoreductase [Clostridiales bacterium]|jgi:protoporphyrinogen oxidase|nr:NAD(P)/FAD-dependent oxidoreductase [Clostridiales bacterium]